MTTLRALNAADAARFKTLRLFAIETSPASFWFTQEDEARRTIDEMAARIRQTDTQVVYGAFEQDALIGIAGLRREPFQKVRHKAVIWGVFVDPAHRRKGIAQDLLKAAVEHASAQWDCAQLRLWVNAENPAAKALYASLGFVTYGMEPRAMLVDGRYYDEELMCKALR
jgi:RimJ/RimL family protein N-acetyltransferase